MKNARLVIVVVFFAGLLFSGGLFVGRRMNANPSTEGSPNAAQTSVAVVVPARAGAVEGTTQNSDEFIRRLFTEFAAPAFAFFDILRFVYGYEYFEPG